MNLPDAVPDRDLPAMLVHRTALVHNIDAMVSPSCFREEVDPIEVAKTGRSPVERLLGPRSPTTQREVAHTRLDRSGLAGNGTLVGDYDAIEPRRPCDHLEMAHGLPQLRSGGESWVLVGCDPQGPRHSPPSDTR